MSGKVILFNYIITDVLTVNLDGDLCVDPPEESRFQPVILYKTCFILTFYILFLQSFSI